MKTNKSRAPARGWVKMALCAGVIMGLSMTAGHVLCGSKTQRRQWQPYDAICPHRSCTGGKG